MDKSLRKIVFLTGTRADFGKLKSLIEITSRQENFEVHIFATGMHMLSKYGATVNEIEKCGYRNIYKYINQTSEMSMDMILAKTIEGLSCFCHEIKPDLVVIHGDRVEALAGAIAGSLNNILVAHIEGGEVSGTIDELIRHAVSKMSHTHFVANEVAKKRLIQMGEDMNSIFVIGSPDVDAMLSDHLPEISSVKKYYEIPFTRYAVLLFHPVTTEADQMDGYAKNIVRAAIDSGLNYVVIYPNNDLGSSDIFRAYETLQTKQNFKLFPSIKFESFLVLLEHAQFILGNSSAGIREAPYYGVPTVNIGTRQMNRSMEKEIINAGYSFEDIAQGIRTALEKKLQRIELYGNGKSDQQFNEILNSERFWNTSKQKHFKDILQ
jgi:UDP-N-acetylglucosamine 2-epimerase (hydrolysing)